MFKQTLFAATFGITACVPTTDPVDTTEGEIAGTYDVVEATIDSIHDAYVHHHTTPRRIAGAYLDRIEMYDRLLHAYANVDDNAPVQAAFVELAGRFKPHGALYGIPMIVKDNIDVLGFPTTAGSLALASQVPFRDSFVAHKLRAAGAVVLGKGTMSELAGFMSLAAPPGYSAAGGFGFNPYDPRVDPRLPDGSPVLSPSGSSSGPAIAVSANLAAAAIGTDTSGSLLSPAGANGIVALRPTTGLVSRTGILPLSSNNDTAGPMARTVTDVAIVLGAITGRDASDPATAVCQTPGNCLTDYRQFLDATALQGARIGVPRFYWQGLPADQVAALQGALDTMAAQGATVEDVDFPPPAPPELLFPPCFAYGQPGCSTALLYSFKRDLNAYLSSPGRSTPAHSLSDIRAYNTAHADVALKYGQSILDAADQMDTSPTSADTSRYLDDLAYDASIRSTLEGVFNGPDGVAGTADDYDVVVFAAGRGANITARSSFPAIVVPAGTAANDQGPPLPDGFDAKPRQIGLFMTGRPFQEGRLLALAYAFEQATHMRQPPAIDGRE